MVLCTPVCVSNRPFAGPDLLFPAQQDNGGLIMGAVFSRATSIKRNAGYRDAGGATSSGVDMAAVREAARQAAQTQKGVMGTAGKGEEACEAWKRRGRPQLRQCWALLA